MARQANIPASPAKQVIDKDAPLKEDIRLLGRLLGNVLREQEGDEVFQVVETVRQTAVRFRRESDAQSGTELNRMLKKLTRDQTVSVVRQYCRGPAPQPPPPRPSAGRLGAAARQHRLGAVPPGRRRHSRFRGAQLLQGSPDFAGADRPPHRSAAQEHSRCGA
jgi:hypothetical protein